MLVEEFSYYEFHLLRKVVSIEVRELIDETYAAYLIMGEYNSSKDEVGLQAAYCSLSYLITSNEHRDDWKLFPAKMLEEVQTSLYEEEHNC